MSKLEGESESDETTESTDLIEQINESLFNDHSSRAVNEMSELLNLNRQMRDLT
ncbi:MAG: hypothetical protein ACRBHB_25065 [Arenicella sp.]